EQPKPYETGRIATGALAAAIERRVGARFGYVTMGWLNHIYGGRWTEPPADQALKHIAEAGFENVVYYPFGFLADNAESLLEGRVAPRTQPGLAHVHIRCLNGDPALALAFAEQG